MFIGIWSSGFLKKNWLTIRIIAKEKVSRDYRPMQKSSSKIILLELCWKDGHICRLNDIHYGVSFKRYRSEFRSHRYKWEVTVKHFCTAVFRVLETYKKGNGKPCRLKFSTPYVIYPATPPIFPDAGVKLHGFWLTYTRLYHAKLTHGLVVYILRNLRP